MSRVKIRGVVFPPYYLVKVRRTRHVKGAQCACHSWVSLISVSPPAQNRELSLPVVNAAGETVTRNLCQIIPVGGTILISHEKENCPKNI